MTRTEALRAAAGIIARSVPNLAETAMLLETAGLGRLAEALRARVSVRPADVVGSARPDAAVWLAAAERLVDGGGRS